MAETDLALCVDHAEYEQAQNGGQHDGSFEVEEGLQLVRPKKGERHMDKPE